MNWELVEFEDVIYLFSEKINNEFKVFIQENISEQLKKNQNTFFQRILNKIGIINC